MHISSAFLTDGRKYGKLKWYGEKERERGQDGAGEKGRVVIEREKEGGRGVRVVDRGRGRTAKGVFVLHLTSTSGFLHHHCADHHRRNVGVREQGGGWLLLLPLHPHWSWKRSLRIRLFNCSRPKWYTKTGG